MRHDWLPRRTWTRSSQVPSTRLLASGLALALAFTATPARAQSTRDSAGVRIVENHRPRWSPASALRLSPTPALVIGDESSEQYQFSRVGGAVRLSDGTIVVADGGSSQLRYFDSAGRFLRAAGRRGEGPGEFGSLELLARLRGDTLIAGAMIRGHGYFTSDGTFVRQASPNTVEGELPDGRRALLGVFDDQSMLIALVPRPAVRPGVDEWIEPMQVHLVDRVGRVVRPFATLPFMLFVNGSNGPRPPWFAPPAAFAFGGQRLYFGFGSEYVIRVYRRGGTLERLIRRAWLSRPVTDADIDAYVVEWSRRWIRETGAEAEQRKRSLRAAPYADVVPAFSQLLVDAAERLWVREAHLEDAPGNGSLNGPALVPSTWSVFDAEGVWLGDVSMPAHFTPRDIGSDYVLGVARDDDGVETIVLYRLEAAER